MAINTRKHIQVTWAINTRKHTYRLHMENGIQFTPAKTKESTHTAYMERHGSLVTDNRLQTQDSTHTGYMGHKCKTHIHVTRATNTHTHTHLSLIHI